MSERKDYMRELELASFDWSIAQVFSNERRQVNLYRAKEIAGQIVAESDQLRGRIAELVAEVARLVDKNHALQSASLARIVERQRDFSLATFGPGYADDRAAGLCDHIAKELREIQDSPFDVEEWIDVVILALDGAWRTGASPDAIVGELLAKQAKNEQRKWPDWRTAEPGKAIEHEREEGRDV